MPIKGQIICLLIKCHQSVPLYVPIKSNPLYLQGLSIVCQPMTHIFSYHQFRGPWPHCMQFDLHPLLLKPHSICSPLPTLPVTLLRVNTSVYLSSLYSSLGPNTGSPTLLLIMLPTTLWCKTGVCFRCKSQHPGIMKRTQTSRVLHLNPQIILSKVTLKVIRIRLRNKIRTFDTYAVLHDGWSILC